MVTNQKLNVNHSTIMLQKFYDALLAHFGHQNWWPGDSPFEIAIGAVLTQNTNWNNVEKAINNLKKKKLIDAQKIISIDSEKLAELIRPSGYFNLKADRLKYMADWWHKNAEIALAQQWELNHIREDLLRVKGIGEETADSILLYAFDYPTFVVDAYTRRFLVRHNVVHEKASYTEIKYFFENHLPHDLAVHREFHALIVALGKTFCKTSSQCENCCLKWHLN